MEKLDIETSQKLKFKVPISQLKEWEHNPKGVKTERYEDLKKQMRKYGQYKPLVVTEDGIILGGNARIKVMREDKWEYAWVSVVHAPDDKTKLEYALSDNDEVGYYEADRLTELILRIGIDPVELGHINVNLGVGITIEELVADFAPSPLDNQPRMDETDPTIFRCPNCGHEGEKADFKD